MMEIPFAYGESRARHTMLRWSTHATVGGGTDDSAFSACSGGGFDLLKSLVLRRGEALLDDRGGSVILDGYEVLNGG